MEKNNCAKMSYWYQKEITVYINLIKKKLPFLKKGCHLITDNILNNLPEIKQIKIGLCHIFCILF